MEMVRIAAFAVTLLSCAWGADFSLAIGNPVAVARPNGVVKKDIGFAVRGENCADIAKIQVTGTAEGVVDGARRSVPLRVIAGETAGTFAISHDWPQQGAWVVNLTGHCGNFTSAAVVPMGPNGFLRESSKFFPRAATAAEVELALKTLTGGGK
jgi:hypothetical protein